MFFLITALMGCMTQAHAHVYDTHTHYDGRGHYHTSVYPEGRWVSGYYGAHGHWVSGYWVGRRPPGILPPPSYPAAPVDRCHRHRDGRRHCGRH